MSRLSYDAALAVLHWLVARARERSLPGVRLNLAARCTLVRLARSLGARDLGTYAWQVLVPDWPTFLHTVAPTLESRLATSAFAGLTDRLPISLYRQHFTLVFDAGRLAAVEEDPGAEAEFHCHPDAFAPLVLGQRTLSELRYQYPDVSIADRRQLLVETLFPPATGFLYTCTG
ncbi:MAG: hypothetical protein H3C34_16440 [Caldilineaceae bacterium]|nr:hypothetical protein [Caldilineaceae bacterium]